MSKNRVQFQKGVSLSHFMVQYGTEEQCQQTLFAWRWPQRFVWPSCGQPKAFALKSRRRESIRAASALQNQDLLRERRCIESWVEVKRHLLRV